jgi:hypothetical protein
MIDISFVLGLLQDNTSYDVAISRDRELNLQDLANLPSIYVGYASIVSRYPKDGIEEDFLDTHGEDLTQAFDIHIVSLPENLSEVWRTVYKALKGASPTVNLSSGATVGTFYYSQGGTIGLSNGKIWWQDRYIIRFPTMNVEF